MEALTVYPSSAPGMMGPGLYLDVSAEAYHKDPCEAPSLSSHVANELLSKSPGHAALIHPRLGGQRFESSDAMDTGSILHGMILGGGQELVPVDANDWRTKAAKEAREDAAAAGKIAVLKDKLDRLQSAAFSVIQHIPFDLAAAKKEVTAIWNSEGCPCRCRLDTLLPDWWIWDLKFCDDVAVSSADRNISSFGYHVQAAANIEAIETLVPGSAGRVHFGLCFVEWKNPAIGIKRVEIRGQLLDVGQHRWRRAKTTWAQCLAQNKWPGCSTEIVEAQCPAWVASEELETQVATQVIPF
jgi:hypothetical protein